ncbi:MAG TPA: TPM domain-containing protein [Methylophilaceae bacterium]|nr:TPM domain-containing protein [Methylophilaceae bacterium]
MIKTKGIRRLFRHLFSTPWHVMRYFPKTTLNHIEQAIKQSEASHSGELRFVVEADLHPLDILNGKLPNARAIELFSQLRIWDTAHNNGILIYLLMADRDVEIIADRGIHAHVGAEGWESICKAMEAKFRQGEFEAGVLLGISLITQQLQQHFPANGPNENELSDKPLIL